jgi:hypothetical protein
MHAAEIFEQGPVRSIAAQRCLPGVHVRVDQAWNDDASLTIDDLGLGGAAAEVDTGTHLRNPAVLDQHIAGTEIANPGVHAADGC